MTGDWRKLVAWGAAGIVFAALTVLHAAGQRDSDAGFVGALLGSMIVSLGAGLLVRWVYFRFLDRAKRRTWSPWVLVIASVLLVATISGQARNRHDEDAALARESLDACRDEPASELLRSPPHGLSYEPPPPGLRKQMASIASGRRAIAKLISMRIVVRRGEEVGRVALMQTADSAETMHGVVAQAEEAGVPVTRDGARFAGVTWTTVDYGPQRGYFAVIGCRVVGALAADDRVARAIGRSLATAQ